MTESKQRIGKKSRGHPRKNLKTFSFNGEIPQHSETRLDKIDDEKTTLNRLSIYLQRNKIENFKMLAIDGDFLREASSRGKSGY